MSASITSPAQIVNLALRRIGSPHRIGNLYDGSGPAKLALDIYAQTRDELLRDGDWQFAQRDISLTAIKQAPPGGYFPPAMWDPTINPPLPWLFEYELPSDYLKVRAVKPVPLLLPVFDPQPYIFNTPNDSSLDPPQKVLVCNVGPTTILTYTGQITDPTTWEPLFVEALAASLARRLAPVLGGPDATKFEAADEQLEKQTASEIQG